MWTNSYLICRFLGAGIMKKTSKYVGLVLSLALLFSTAACKKDSTDSESSVTQTEENTTENISEEETSETTEKNTTEATTSEETSDTSEPTSSDPEPEKDIEEDLYNYYASSRYQLPDAIHFDLNDQNGEWWQQVGITTENWRLTSCYSVDGIEYFTCYFKISPLERVNDYSYKTTILEAIDERADQFEDPVDHHGTPPYSFNVGDELILYMPNAPIPEVPLPRWDNQPLLSPDDAGLQAFNLYNSTSGLVYSLGMHPMLPSTVLSEDEMEFWYGEYIAKEAGEVKIYKDADSGEMRVDYHYVNYVYPEEKWFKNMSVRKVVDDPKSIYAFGEAEDGSFIIIGIEYYEDEGVFPLSVYEYSSDGEYICDGMGFGVMLVKKT